MTWCLPKPVRLPTEFRERVFLPQLWYFFTDKIFSSTQAIRTLYATVNCTTISNIFIQWKSWFFWGGSVFYFLLFFEAVAFIPEQTFSFQGDPSKALDCVCNYYNFPHPFVIPGFWLVCTNIVRYQPDMLLIVWFLCFPIWLLSFLVSAHYFGFDAAKVPEVGNTVFAGWTEHCSQAEITAALSTINADWARSLIQSQSIFREWCDMSGCHYPPSKNKIEKHLHFLYTLLEFFVSALKCQMCFYDKWISSFWSGGEAKWFLRDISVPFTSWCAVLHIYCMTSAGLDRRSIQECSSDIYGIRC